jgi:hypothetical protein
VRLFVCLFVFHESRLVVFHLASKSDASATDVRMENTTPAAKDFRSHASCA